MPLMLALGNSMMLINSISYGAYLVIVKPLTKKYQHSNINEMDVFTWNFHDLPDYLF